jgi:LDH2 family malate/lactate/ureidoglycolate dehydrogenase
MLKAGKINPRPQFKIVTETDSTATLDGDNGLGLIVGNVAMQKAIEKALKHGSGFVAVCNSNHFGIGQFYSEKALEHGCIGICMSNSVPLMSPPLGRERMLGSNPMSIAFPGPAEDKSVVCDFASTVTAYGKIEVAARQGEEIPEGWGLDDKGQPTTDANRVIEGGSLLPLGGDLKHGAAKGYGLAAMIDILSGVLSGAKWGPYVPPYKIEDYKEESQDEKQQVDPTLGKGTGHFFGAWRVDAFRPIDAFVKEVDAWRDTMRASKTVKKGDQVLCPGDIEKDKRKERESGCRIPLRSSMIQQMEKLAKDLGVKVVQACE